MFCQIVKVTYITKWNISQGPMKVQNAVKDLIEPKMVIYGGFSFFYYLSYCSITLQMEHSFFAFKIKHTSYFTLKVAYA